MRLFRPSDHRILIVESDGEVLRMVHAALRREGYKVTPADDVTAALEIASQWAPSLILTEVELPGASGLELCQKLRADRRFARTPIIIASTLASERSEER